MKKAFYLILTAFILLPGYTFSQTREITLADIFSRKFNPKGTNSLAPMNDGQSYCVLENDSINVYAYETGSFVRTLARGGDMVPAGDTAAIKLASWTFSQDEKKLLIPTATDYIYRYSSVSEFFIWDTGLKKLTPLSLEGKQRLATFSPDGTKVAFVRDNNLFIKDLVMDTEYPVTFDGKQNEIINGTTDWVYEEEFAITKGFEWSPDGNRIAYYRFDESQVKEFSMMEWGELYPAVERFKYPKAGEDNSIVQVFIFDLRIHKSIPVDVGPETDQYLPRIMWTKDVEKLAIVRMNRLQNKMDLLLADAATGRSNMIFREDNQWYIDDSHLDHFIFLDNNQYLTTSEKSGHYHIYLNKIDLSAKGAQLTTGEWDVTDVYGYDEATGLVWFGAATSSPINREIWTVDLKGNMKQVSKEEGTHRPQFSTGFKYYVDNFSTAGTPPVYTVYSGKGKALRVLEDNLDLRNQITDYRFGKKEFFTFTTSEGVQLHGWKILPPNFDPAKKYPVFMTVYGGPGSQTVLNSFSAGEAWHHMLAQKGYIIASVDNRGTGARGQDFKKITYLQLGKYETIDQIEAARYFAAQPYVDPARIGIWGWSYGGYMSALCLTKGADVFSMAISVAPVTNWRYYDNIYTERYMRKPQDNAAGYDDNSPIRHVDKLKGKFLLIHGTADDNVHVQNSMDLADALIKAGKQFDMFLYPNRNHGIYGGNTRLHLYEKMTEFVVENL
jgi:dipeptidyl-peptidase-4